MACCELFHDHGVLLLQRCDRGSPVVDIATERLGGVDVLRTDVQRHAAEDIDLQHLDWIAEEEQRSGPCGAGETIDGDGRHLRVDSCQLGGHHVQLLLGCLQVESQIF